MTIQQDDGKQALSPCASTRFYIDGFRSLKEFEVQMNPGLNVLVGPNGSGKSNFIDFLDFLHTFLRSNAPLAVARAGGISRVFSQENLRKSSPSLVVKVSGTSFMAKTVRQPITGYYKYHYELEIRYSKSLSAIYVRKESLKLGRLRKTLERAIEDTTFLGILAMERPNHINDAPPRWSASKKLMTRVSTNPLSASDSLFSNRSNLAEDIPRSLERFSHEVIESDQSFLSEFPRSRAPAVDAVRNSMTRGRSFNIAPGQARAPDDLSKPPYIDRDGSGLTATLYHLQLSRLGRKDGVVLLGRKANSETLNSIIEWTKLIYPQMNDIHIVSDIHSGRYAGTISIKGPQTLKIPFSSVSDGTIKWLVLVTVILTFGGTYSLEEPENFLYPKMQQFLIGLIRESLSDGDGTSYFVVSTHSETLINECSPSELVIFDFVEQKTFARRVRDPKKVIQEINNTGFGLGYYFANNAIS